MAKSPIALEAKKSAARDPLGIQVDRIYRLAGGHEEAVPLAPAKAQIGASLRERNMADHRGIRGKDGDAVEPWRHPPPAPLIALDIATETVRSPLAGIDEDAPIGELGAVFDHIKNTDQPRPGA